MPAIMPMGGAVRDLLLNVSGSDDDPTQTVTADTYGPTIYVGEGRRFAARLTVAGAVSGTTPTLDAKLECSADGVTGFTTLAAFPQRTTSNLVATGANTAPDKLVATMPTGKNYLRVFFDVGGTTPSFGSVSVLLWGDAGFAL